MRNPTIWESASRPLFVRSIWLETTATGRAHQRHFILDYEPRKLKRQMKGDANSFSAAERRGAKLPRSQSCDFVHWTDTPMDVDDDDDDDDDVNTLLVGSAKVKLQPSPAQQQLKSQPRLNKPYKRPLCGGRHRTHRFDQGRCLNELYDLYSRRSSLQDIQSTLSQADERLAERVLNWLDLAAKQDTLTVPSATPSGTDVNSVKKKQPKPTPMHSGNNSHKIQRAKTAHAQRLSLNKSPHKTKNATVAFANRAESVKHITIIFNKEGVPVRYNRPARNIDLCALSTSPRTTRRMAGPLASARLYNGAGEACAGRKMSAQTKKLVSAGTQRHDSNAESGMKPLQKGVYEESEKRGFYDAKKQLHIFMPSLPKKGLLRGSGCASVEDTASGLSNTFSELCRI